VVAVSCDINADDTAPAHGQLVTFVYSVDGNDPVDPTSATVRGAAVVGGTRYDVSTTMTLPGTPAASEQFEVPSSDSGLVFQSTSDPAKFTCTIP
jgi:hypothetical protein